MFTIPESVFTIPESLFTIPGIAVHDPPESVFTMLRNTQTSGIRACRRRFRDASRLRGRLSRRMILILREPATREQSARILEDVAGLVKLVVDTRRGIMTGGGEMHADGEALLLADGSQQEDLWGANWYPDSDEARFEALINIRPRDGNRRLQVESEATRAKMEAVIRRLLGGRG